MSSHVNALTAEETELQHEYQTYFDSNDYLERYTGINCFYNKYGFTSLHHVISNDLAKGNSLLEIGCGPTIQSVISACGHFEQIIQSDFLESNRATVLKWLKNEPGAHDWSLVFKHVATLEKEEDYRKLEERVRRSVTDVIFCDVLQPNPIASLERQFDCIVTSYCLEGATTDVSSYKKAVGNVAHLLNPGGTLVIVGELKGTFYYVGNKRFPVPVVTKDLVHAALSDANLNVVYWSDEPVPVFEFNEYCDCTGLFVVVAKK